MRNPILIELTRGALVESTHAGVVALARPNGELVAGVGDVAAPVFPRSAIKPLQALPFLESGAAEHFGFGGEETAIACGSHTGTARHVAVVERLLARIGLGVEALGCGAHEPMDAAAAWQLDHSGAQASPLHHNCSGKHAAMLATAVHLGEPVKGYWRPDHPVQERIRRVLEDVTGCALGAETCGIDGCSVPNWAIPPAGLARAFARLATGEMLGPQRAQACARIVAACTAHPDLVAGPGRFDTLALQRLSGKLLVKAGAEGVYCGAFPGLQLGFALKIEDGAKRAAEAVAAHIIGRVHAKAGDLGPAAVIKNWRGVEVGQMRASAELATMLREVR